MFKKLILSLLTLIVIVIAGLAIFVTTFDANKYKEEITSLVKKQTGRDLEINGDLELTMYPDIALEMGKTSITNAEGFADKEFAVIESGRVSVKLMPLLKKQIQADAILLDGLQLNLHRKADGSTNWEQMASDGTDEAKPAEESENQGDDKEPSEVIEELMQNLSIAGVSLKNANIHWQDDQANQDITISPLNLTTGKFVAGEPLPVELEVVVNQKAPAMNIAAEGSTTITLSNDNKNFDLSKLKLHAKVTGAQIPNGAFDANLSGDIKGSAEKVTVSGLTLDSTLTGDLIPEGEVKTNISGNVDFDLAGQKLTIAGMKLDNNVSGAPLAGGTLQALIGGDIALDLASLQLSIPNLALDAKLANGYVKGGEANTKVNGNLQLDLGKQVLAITGMKAIADANGELLQGGSANANIDGDIQVDLANSQVTSPQLNINSTVEGGLVPGGKLTQTAKGNLDLNWANNQGGVNLAELLVSVAGLELKGTNIQLQPLAEKPAITGQFQTNTFNLKELLKTLDIEAPATSKATALTQLQAQFELDASTDKVDLKGLTVKLDESQLSGNLGINDFAAPNVITQLTIDSINIDDYLAASSSGDASAPAAASNGSGGGGGGGELLPLETLRKLNIDGDFKIGNMVINKLTMTNVNAKVNAKQGLIVIDPANAQLYKGKYVGQITIDAKPATPTMKMRHELTGIRSEGLLFDLFQDKYISGGAKMLIELSSSGNTIEALLKNLNGTSTIGFNDGTIRDSNLAEKVSLAVKAFEKTEIKDGESVVNFTGLSGDFKTTNGVFTTDNLSMLSPYFNITGAGSADVTTQKLDMKLRIGPKTQDPKRPLFAPLSITGTFSDPKFSLDMKDLIKALAAQDLKELELEAKAKLDKEKEALKLKVENEKKALELKVKEEQKALQQKLENEKSKQLEKVEKAKTEAIDKIKSTAGEKVGNQLLNTITGKKATPAKTDEKAAPAKDEEAKEEPKSTKDNAKDKLNDKLKSLF